ncbi:MAG TPA: potassium transporter TrkG [Opitutaceae bacterium]
MAENDSRNFKRALDISTLAVGLGAAGLLLVEYGFALAPARQEALITGVRVVLWTMLGLQLLRETVNADWTRRRWRCLSPLAVNGALLVLLALEAWLVPVLRERWPGPGAARWQVLYLTTVHVLVLGVFAHRLLHFNQLLAFARISPRSILISSYLALIGLGTLLLKLPNATTTPLSWLDALFTSTSAVCVTGLIVVDTATAFTPTGQTILLILIQLGGLGLMTFTYFFVSLFGSGITIRDRALLLEFLNEEYVGRVSGSLIAIVVMTLIFEAGGAVLLHATTPATADGTWFESVFHSVSAFCNAGFSIYSAGLYDPITRSNLPYQGVIMGLIVVGGLGFPVLKNLWDNFVTRLARPRERPVRLTTHTRLVLATTAGLVAGGALLLFVVELPSEVRAGEAPRWFVALFNSVTARTAGFNTIPMDALLPAGALVMIFLMFIGGSPASTAGGIKTTTFAIALLNTLRILRDASGDLVAFRRQIPASVASRAFAVALLAIAWAMGSALLLALLMPEAPPLDVIFETVSAFSTVGLSRGLTGTLPAAGKIVIVASMLVGRVGILYVALGVLRKERPGRLAYPESNVIIS